MTRGITHLTTEQHFLKGRTYPYFIALKLPTPFILGSFTQSPPKSPNFHSISYANDEGVRRTTGGVSLRWKPQRWIQQHPATPRRDGAVSTAPIIHFQHPLHVLRHRLSRGLLLVRRLIRRSHRLRRFNSRRNKLRGRGATPRRARYPSRSDMEKDQVHPQSLPGQPGRPQGLRPFWPDPPLYVSLPLSITRREDPIRRNSRLDRRFLNLPLRRLQHVGGA